jgi:hypothetical protein
MEAIRANRQLTLRRILSGARVVKYGEAIGEATQPIPLGAHVHIQNVRSRRVRPRESQQ